VVGEREPIDTLQDQREPEDELQLDDHRRLVAADGHDVAAAHLGLDVVALALEKRLHGGIEVGLARRRAAGHRRDST